MSCLRTLLKAAQERLDSRSGRLLLVLSCVLVFSFAFHAKVAIYHHPGHIDGSTASKMWPAGGQLESGLAGTELTVLWLCAFLFMLMTLPAQRRLAVRRSAVPLPRTQQFYSKRFQRPPPQY
jgi:hypothetical protein